MKFTKAAKNDKVCKIYYYIQGACILQ